MKSEVVRIIPRVSFYCFIYQAAILIVQKQLKINIYRPQTKLRKCNVFTPVCQSFCSWGVVYPSMHWGRQTHPGQTPPCPVHAGIHTPCPVHAGIHPPGSHCCGHYASYWNAFLCFKFLFSWYCFYLRTVNV